ncbi:MAG: SulP family inorganic anion transporter, partial [Hyphomicrobiaceae bacterium]|nr:SulP family inorganic anion transporter [Hyphomicrobiaceae bacterium]
MHLNQTFSAGLKLITRNLKLEKFFPFLVWFRLVTKDSLKVDFIAGITGAVIVLPQGVAFALIAGLPPEYGLYTAMVTPIIAALFGSSMHLISGPTTAISIVIFSAVSHHAEPFTPEFITLALTITFLAGVYQFILGIARMGVLVNFVSHTVVIGFTAGAAILIATSQMKNILGIEVARGESFVHTWVEMWHKLGDTNSYILATALATFASAILIKKMWPKAPHLLLSLIIGSAFAALLGGHLHGIGFVGKIPAHLPPLSTPDFSFATIKMLAPEAFAVALLGLIEAVSISRSIASKSHQRIDGNQEFIGQGLSNIAGSFFSSYAGSGSFTRSGINYSSGATSPFSAIFAAIILMIIILLIAPLAAYLPVAAMGGVILLVAYNLIDFEQIKHVLESSGAETAILLTTFFATLFLELEFAIYLGVLLSLVIFLGRTSTPEIITLAPDLDRRYDKHTLTDVETKPLTQCPQLKILRIDMSVYFGSVNHVQSKIFEISEKEGIYDILIIGEGINLIDLTGTEMLMHEAERLEEKGGGLYFACLKPQVYYSIS